MQIQEQIYTSAARLLEGGGNLGVVARTRAFPADVAAELASLRSYTPLPGVPTDTIDRHQPRLVGSPRSGGCYSLSRIAFGGFDHTGRTSPLVHHVVITMTEVRSAGLTPGGLLATVDPMFVRRHEGEPHWIDPPRAVNHAIATNLPNPPGYAQLLLEVASAVFAFASTRRPAVVVVAKDMDVIPIVAGVLNRLPASVGWSTTWVTHVADTADYVRDAALVLTYPGTPFLEQCRFRKDGRAPLVFDPASPAPSPSAGTRWATVIGSSDPVQSAELCRRWDTSALEPSQLGKFARAASIVADLKVADPSEVVGLTGRIASIADPPALQSWVSDEAVRLVSRLSADPVALAVLAASDPWPTAARASAVEMVVSQAASGRIAALAELARRRSTADALVRQRVERDPSVISTVFQSAIATNEPADIAAASYLIEVGPVDPFDAIGMAERVPSLSSPQLTDAVIQAVTASLTSHDRIALLQDAVAAQVDSRAYCRAVALPAARRRMEQLPVGPLWTELFDLFVLISINASDVPAQVAWCVERFRERLQKSDLDRWLNNQLVATSDREAVRRIGVAAGIVVDGLPSTSMMARGAAEQGRSDSDARDRTSRSDQMDDRFQRRSSPLPGGGASLFWWMSVVFFALALTGLLAQFAWPVVAHAEGSIGHRLRSVPTRATVRAIVGEYDRPFPRGRSGIMVVAVAGMLWASSRWWALWVGGGRMWIPWVLPLVLLAAATVAWFPVVLSYWGRP